MFKLKAHFDADLLLYYLSHFESDSHTVHMLNSTESTTPLTSTVKSSLFMHVHSRPIPWLPGYINVAQTVLIILTRLDVFRIDLIYLPVASIWI